MSPQGERARRNFAMKVYDLWHQFGRDPITPANFESRYRRRPGLEATSHRAWERVKVALVSFGFPHEKLVVDEAETDARVIAIVLSNEVPSIVLEVLGDPLEDEDLDDYSDAELEAMLGGAS